MRASWWSIRDWSPTACCASRNGSERRTSSPARIADSRPSPSRRTSSPRSFGRSFQRWWRARDSPRNSFGDSDNEQSNREGMDMATNMNVVNVTDLIDQGSFGGYQLWIFAICFAIALMDGLDSQAIGVTAPLMAADLHLSPGALGPIFAASQWGFMLGALAFGPCADRWGRKQFLLASSILFALPGGGMITGFLASYLLPLYGWRSFC